jgi:hypothetical protein
MPSRPAYQYYLAFYATHLIGVLLAFHILFATELAPISFLGPVLAALVPPILIIFVKAPGRRRIYLISMLIISLPTLLVAAFWGFAALAYGSRIG